MNTHQHPDLFPETLLVTRENDKIFTTSMQIADHFGKRHDNVMRDIRKAMEESPEHERLLNFEESLGVFISANGAKRERPIFKLTHDGFLFIAQGFTGKVANEWKWKFIAAFRSMEQQLEVALRREAAAMRMMRPMYGIILDNPGKSRKQIIAISGHKSAGTVTSNRARMRMRGLLN